MTLHDSAQFDAMLTAALRSRPDPEAGIDLVGEAISRAQWHKAGAERLAQQARLNRWTRWLTVAAALLIAITLAVGYTYMPSDASDTTTSSVSSTTTTSSDLTTVGLAAFVVTLMGTTVASLLTAERVQIRVAAG